jgi:hypothetical protein
MPRCQHAGTMAYMAPELRCPGSTCPAGKWASAINARALDIYRCVMCTEHQLSSGAQRS